MELLVGIEPTTFSLRVTETEAQTLYLQGFEPVANVDMMTFVAQLFKQKHCI